MSLIRELLADFSTATFAMIGLFVMMHIHADHKGRDCPTTAATYVLTVICFMGALAFRRNSKP